MSSGLVLGQIVVDGDDVDPPARQSIQVSGQNGNQGLAFAGLHLGDTALMQHNAANELDGVGPQTDDPVRRLPDSRESLWEQLVQSLPCLQPVLEGLGLAPQLFLAHLLILGFQSQDGIYHRLDLFDFTLGTGSKQLGHESHWDRSFLFFHPGQTRRVTQKFSESMALYHSRPEKYRGFCKHSV